MNEGLEQVTCAEPGCTNTIKNHAWGKIKSDWFFQKDGRSWCTQHIPDWVTEWRQRTQQNIRGIE